MTGVFIRGNLYTDTPGMRAQKKDHLRTQREGQPSAAQGERTQEKQACWYLHLGLVASRTVRQRRPLFKPSVCQCVVAPAEYTLLVPHALKTFLLDSQSPSSGPQ